MEEVIFTVILVVPEIIYQNLADFLAEHLQVVAQKLRSAEENLLLETYLTEWDHYAAAASRIDRLLNLLNRHWIKRSIDEGKGDIYRIRTLHFLQWRVYAWERISESVIDAAQYTIQRDDDKAAMFHDVLERFASLQVDDSATSPSSNSRDGIRASLEAPFVPEIEDHDRKIQQMITARFHRMN
ncbi:cullin 1 [Fusarium heterosporum]|uniref:Cullin 1 n=1 Tax=Fusarium heterosporum TaxID=42747 RepID=A0A8H5TFA3_FUSHE|nr:cullin 1 [Fusarium heterosporum]